jgi:hypothetical protein
MGRADINSYSFITGLYQDTERRRHGEKTIVPETWFLSSSPRRRVTLSPRRSIYPPKIVKWLSVSIKGSALLDAPHPTG